MIGITRNQRLGWYGHISVGRAIVTFHGARLRFYWRAI